MIRIKKAWDLILGPQIICAECSSVAPRTGPSQRYCVACSERRSATRKLKWRKSNPPGPTAEKAARSARRVRQVAKGIAVGAEGRWTLADIFPDEAGMAWVRRLSVPFTYAMSKNHAMKLCDKGHVFLRAETKAARGNLSLAVTEALGGMAVPQNKIWIELLIEKPNHRGDAINILDHAADAIKHAVGIDDRWFCIRRVDWRVMKEDPRVFIGIGQEVAEDASVCSCCGRLLPLGRFGKNSRRRFGIARECLDCSNPLGRSARGCEVGGAKLDEDKVVEIRRLVAAGVGQKEVAASFGVGRTTVGMIARRQTWNHI